jgi:hypothetical protein
MAIPAGSTRRIDALINGEVAETEAEQGELHA